MIIIVLFSFIIDDGSGTAFVSCTDCQVAQLLDLNAEQWTDLEQLVQPVRSVLYELVSNVCLCLFVYVYSP